jgi:hypothetical protein
MSIPVFVRLRALFAHDKNEFWWNHFTDKERELRQMDVMALAAALHEAQVKGNEQQRIVVQYMLTARLANLQAKASWGSGILGFAGAILGAALAAAVTVAVSKDSDSTTLVTCACQTPASIASSSSAHYLRQEVGASAKASAASK